MTHRKAIDSAANPALDFSALPADPQQPIRDSRAVPRRVDRPHCPVAAGINTVPIEL